MTRPRLLLLAKGGLSVTLTGYLVSRVDGGEVAAALGAAAGWWLVLALALTGVAALCNTLKWWLLCRSVGTAPPIATLLQLHYLGMFYGLVLPGQVGGELMKMVRLREVGVPAAQSAVSITLDRLTGLVALGLLATTGLLLSPRADLRAQFLPAGVGLALLSVALLPLLRRRDAPKTGAVPGWRLPRPMHAAWVALSGYRARGRDLTAALALALVFQLLVVVSNYCVALGVGATVAPFDLLWIVGLVSLVNLLPIALAGLGVREGAYVLLLNQNGVPESVALALALLVFVLLMTQGIAGGLIDALAFRGRRLPGEAATVVGDG